MRLGLLLAFTFLAVLPFNVAQCQERAPDMMAARAGLRVLSCAQGEGTSDVYFPRLRGASPPAISTISLWRSGTAGANTRR